MTPAGSSIVQWWTTGGSFRPGRDEETPP